MEKDCRTPETLETLLRGVMQLSTSGHVVMAEHKAEQAFEIFIGRRLTMAAGYEKHDRETGKINLREEIVS